MRTGDTIAAIATPPGHGGVGIIRISGERALTIAHQIARQKPRPRFAHVASFFDADERVLDDGLLLSFPAPRSFTGEDVVELHAHGSPVVLRMLLQRVLELGARIAEPGEFTRRAFCNNKIDLAQAEAVSDLIASTATQSARSALRVLRGEFSAKIRRFQETLTALRVRAESAIDFSDDSGGVDDALDDAELRQSLLELRAQLGELLKSGEQGALLSSGAEIAIVGRPNVGKSSLLNCLSQRDEAIVSDAPGTTRDIVKCDLLIRGIPVRVLDTAGLRATDEAAELEGMRRARDAMQHADLVLIVFDAAQTDTEEEQAWLDELSAQDVKTVRIANKIDLLDDLPTRFALDAVGVSAKTGDRLDALQRHIAAELGVDETVDDALGAQQRHLSALRVANEAVDRALAHASDRSVDLLAEDLAAAHAALGEIVGEWTTEDLLGEIFSRFCIGK